MRVSAVGIVAFALTVACAAAPSADAARSDALGKLPAIVQPHPHSDLHNEFTAEATSTHARVAFVMEDGDNSITVSADVVGGTATATVPAWGFSGLVRVRARDCDGHTCGDLRSSPSGLTVTNDPLAVVLPAGPVDITAGESLVPVLVPSAGGFVKLSLDGEIVLHADGGIGASLDFTHLPDGVYHATVWRCSPIDHTVCGEKAELPSIRVLRKLAPHAASDPIPPISPNGDGVRDAAMRDLAVLPAWAPPLGITATWTLTDANGDEAATGSIAVPAGERGTTFRVDPLAEGFALDDGKYTLWVDASAVFDGQLIQGSVEYDDPIVVDNTAPALADPKMSARTFYPAARKGKPRFVTGTVQVPGDATVHVDIVDGDGKVVRSVDVGSAGHGAAQYRWSGARGNGKLASAGHYRMVWTAVDRAGNPSDPIKGPWVTLSHKRQAPGRAAA